MSIHCSPVLHALCSVHTPTLSAGQSSNGSRSSYYHIPPHGPYADGNGTPSHSGRRRRTRPGDPRANGDAASRPCRLSSACGVGNAPSHLSPASLCRYRPPAPRRRDRVPDQQNHEVLEGNHMKIIYDRETDTLTVIFTETPVAESDEDKPGVILDYDAAGNLVSLEILDASQRVTSPSRIEYQVAPMPG